MDYLQLIDVKVEVQDVLRREAPDEAMRQDEFAFVSSRKVSWSHKKCFIDLILPQL